MEQVEAAKAIVTDVFSRWEDLKTKRMPFEADWDLITRYCAPRRIGQEFTAPRSLIARHLTDTTAVDAGERFPALLYGYLVGGSRAFVIPEIRGRDKVNHEESVWLDAVREKIHKFFKHGDTTFKRALYRELYQWVNFGTGEGWTGGSFGSLPRYRAMSILDCWYDRDADGKIFIFYRRYHMSASAAVREYPGNEEIGKLAKKNGTLELEFVEAVSANEGGRAGAGKLNKPFLAHTINVDNKILLNTEGYDSMPFDAAVFQGGPDDIYGRGCGHKAVPIAERLNDLHHSTVDGAKLAVRPPLFDFSNGALPKFDMRDGAVNQANFSALGMNNLRDVLQSFGPTGDLRPGIEMINKAEFQIEKAYYIDWMSNGSGPAKTAYEVSDNRDLRFKSLSPMTGNLENDMLGPKIDRTFSLMSRYGAFPPMPDSLANETIDFGYRSELTAALDSGEVEAIMRSLGLAKEIADIDPDVVDNIDGDTLYRQGASDFGLPHGLVRSPEEVSEIREARAEQEAEAEQLSQAQAGAAALRDGAQGVASLENASAGSS